MMLGLLVLAVAVTPPSGGERFYCPYSGETSRCIEADDCPVLRIEPIFPDECVGDMALEEGVTVRLAVSQEGRVESSQIIESSNACFNTAALMNACRYRYDAATDDDREIIETVYFRIEDDPDDDDE